jgi:hypothetical protein
VNSLPGSAMLSAGFLISEIVSIDLFSSQAENTNEIIVKRIRYVFFIITIMLNHIIFFVSICPSRAIP